MKGLKKDHKQRQYLCALCGMFVGQFRIKTILLPDVFLLWVFKGKEPTLRHVSTEKHAHKAEETTHCNLTSLLCEVRLHILQRDQGAAPAAQREMCQQSIIKATFAEIHHHQSWRCVVNYIYWFYCGVLK